MGDTQEASLFECVCLFIYKKTNTPLTQYGTPSPLMFSLTHCQNPQSEGCGAPTSNLETEAYFIFCVPSGEDISVHNTFSNNVFTNPLSKPALGRVWSTHQQSWNQGIFYILCPVGGGH